MENDFKHIVDKFFEGKCSKDEIVFLEEQLKDYSKKEYFQKLESQYNALEIITNESEFSTADGYSNFQNSIHKGRRLNLIPLFKYAAVFIVSISLTVLVMNMLDDGLVADVSPFEISTPIGSRSKIVLPDGTKVWLNSGSGLTHNFKQNSFKRVVNLKGEAFFDVATDSSRRFVVKTTDIDVTVYGTEFNIKAYPEDKTIETTLVSGRLSVKSSKGTGLFKKETMLKPNQSAVYLKPNKTEVAKSEKRKIEVSTRKVMEDVTSWKDEKLVFIDEPMSSLVVKLQRWYGVEITIEDKKLLNYKYTGRFENNETIHQFMRIIELTTPIEYTIDKNIVNIKLKKQADL